MKTPYLESKRHRICKFILAVVITAVLLCLFGCAKNDPVGNIVDNHSNHIGEVLDYAKQNFDQTAEIKYLENELESCILVLDDVKQAHYAKIDTCEAQTNYWKLATLGLFLLILGAIFAKLKGWLKCMI